jgi:hypothetical protein
MKRFLLPILIIASSLSAWCQYATVNATLTDGSGSFAPSAYLHFSLRNCGANFPVVSGQGFTPAKVSFDLKPNPSTGIVTGQVVGNDAILCGNVASTYYEVAMMKDPNTAFSPEMPFIIHSGTAWTPASQPMSNAPGTPGFAYIFGNPTAGHVITRPVTGSGGTATATESGGAINSCTASGGTGYTSAPALVVSGGGGSGAILRATVLGGVVTGCTVVTPGTGYSSNPSVAVFGGTSLAIQGVLDLSAATVIQSSSLPNSVLSGNNTFTGNNTFGGPVTFNSTFTFASSLNAPVMNNVQYANQIVAGSDLGAKIALADTALGGNAGQIWVTASGNISETALTLSANHDLLCVGDNVVLTMLSGANIQQSSGTRVKGCVFNSTQTSAPSAGGEIYANGVTNVEVSNSTFIGGGSHIHYTGVSSFRINNYRGVGITTSGSGNLSSPIAIINSNNGQINNPRFEPSTFPAGSFPGSRGGLIFISASIFVQVNGAIIANVDASQVAGGAGGISFAGGSYNEVHGGSISVTTNMDSVLVQSATATSGPATDLIIDGLVSATIDDTGGVGGGNNNLGSCLDIIAADRVAISNVICLNGGNYTLNRQPAVFLFLDDYVNISNSKFQQSGESGIETFGTPHTHLTNNDYILNQSDGVIAVEQNGTVSVSGGTNVTWVTGVTGGFGLGWQPGTSINIGGSWSQIASVNSNTSLTLSTAVANNSGFGPYTLSQVTVSGGNTTYTGTGFASTNAMVGFALNITGFTLHTGNNVSNAIVLSNTTTSITVARTTQANETDAGLATTVGQGYFLPSYDTQVIGGSAMNNGTSGLGANIYGVEFQAGAYGIVSGLTAGDERASKTQTYGVYVNPQAWASIINDDLGGGCQSCGNATAPIFGSTVASLPAVAASVSKQFTVIDSTTITAEGQTCVGGSTHTATAINDGTTWKCF